MLVPMGKPAARLVWHLVLALLSWLGVQERTTSLRRRLRTWLLRSWLVTRVCRAQVHPWVRQYNDIGGGAMDMDDGTQGPDAASDAHQPHWFVAGGGFGGRGRDTQLRMLHAVRGGCLKCEAAR